MTGSGLDLCPVMQLTVSHTVKLSCHYTACIQLNTNEVPERTQRQDDPVVVHFACASSRM